MLSHVAQSCYSVIGDKPFLWSKAKFDPPWLRTAWTDYYQNCNVLYHHYVLSRMLLACSDDSVHYKSAETVNFCGFRCAFIITVALTAAAVSVHFISGCDVNNVGHGCQMLWSEFMFAMSVGFTVCCGDSHHSRNIILTNSKEMKANVIWQNIIIILQSI